MTGPGAGPASVAALFLERVRESPGEEAFRYPADGGWVSLTWADVRHDVRCAALGLHALGLRPEERCAIVASTRVEWVLADLGILCAGGATATVPPSCTAEECARILAASGARVCFADGEEQVAMLRSVRGALPALERVVVFDGAGAADRWVVPWERLLADGRAVHAMRPGQLEALVEAIAPSALATVVYASANAGAPEAVELTHACWLSRSAALRDLGLVDHADPLHLLRLPLAHLFGRLMIALQLRLGLATVVDGRPEKLAENLVEVRPTILCAVPRVLEELRAAVLQDVRAAGRVRGALAEAALGAAVEALRLERSGGTPGPALRLRRALAERLVLGKVRARLGGRARLLVSGAAPLPPEVEEFFAAAGVGVLEGDGVAGTSAATHGDQAWRPARLRA